jgi:hypothetical protein
MVLSCAPVAGLFNSDAVKLTPDLFFRCTPMADFGFNDFARHLQVPGRTGRLSPAETCRFRVFRNSKHRNWRLESALAASFGYFTGFIPDLPNSNLHFPQLGG